MGASNSPDLRFAKPTPRTRTRRVEKKAAKQQRRSVYDLVDDRDKERCQLTGRKGNVYSVDPLERIHHHHIDQRGRDGGDDTTENLVSVIRDVHNLIHQNRIVVSGNADEALTWTIKADAVRELWGTSKVPASLRPAAIEQRLILVVADEDWPEFIRGAARWR